MPELTICNAQGRDAQIAAETTKIPVRIRRLDRDGRQCASQRILKGTLDTGLPELVKLAAIQKERDAKAPIADVAQVLIAGDPEIDLETVGMFLRDTKRAYVNPAGQVLHAVTHLEIVRNPDGSEKARRPHAVQACNVGAPFLWSGRFVSRAEAARKYVFASKRQLFHVNGLTYDFLYAIARELEEKDALLLVGAGPKANQPLILRRGALPYRGFLEGRTRGDQYCLLLHLSNLELKALKENRETTKAETTKAVA
jgi:hypothetical protein